MCTPNWFSLNQVVSWLSDAVSLVLTSPSRVYTLCFSVIFVDIFYCGIYFPRFYFI